MMVVKIFVVLSLFLFWILEAEIEVEILVTIYYYSVSAVPFSIFLTSQENSAEITGFTVSIVYCKQFPFLDLACESSQKFSILPTLVRL
jgi:hypothetical protein